MDHDKIEDRLDAAEKQIEILLQRLDAAADWSAEATKKLGWMKNRLVAAENANTKWAIYVENELAPRIALLEAKLAAKATDKRRNCFSETLQEFIAERCEVGPDQSVLKSDLYRSYVAWCNERGIPVTSERNVFGRRLRGTVKEIRPYQPRDGQGQRLACYGGIGLKPAVAAGIGEEMDWTDENSQESSHAAKER